MGKGNYLGGSTIVGPYTKWSDGTPPPKKKRSKEVRNQFLVFIIESELKGYTVTSIPDAFSRFSTSVRESGGVHKWAKSQPKYDEIKSLIIQKYENKKFSNTSANTNDLLASIAKIEARIRVNKEIAEKARLEIERDEQMINNIISDCVKQYEQ